MSDDRPARYVEEYEGGERVVYRASSLGICDRVFVALSQGMEPMAWPDWFQEILDEGTAQEEVIRTMYAEQGGWDVDSSQALLEMEIIPGVWIRGHIDGAVIAKDLVSVWEGKKVRTSGWARFLRQGVEWQKNYPWQVSFYMHAMQKKYPNREVDCILTGGHFDPDKGEVTEIHSHTLTNPPVPLKALKLRIMKLESMIEDDESVMEVACPSKPDYPCPFYFLHDDDAPEPAERPGDDVIEPLLQEWAELKSREEEAKKIYNPNAKDTKETLKRLKEGITAWLEASGADGEETAVTIGDKQYIVKSIEVHRKGYEVKATDYTQVSVKMPEKDK